MGDVDVLVSGIQGDLNLPFPIKYKLHGFGFIFGKSGGVDKDHTVQWDFFCTAGLYSLNTLPQLAARLRI